MPQIEFKFGDRVVHSLRPEWGTGVVTQAQSTIIDGKPAQRLTLRFDRAGLKTLSSPPAELEHAVRFLQRGPTIIRALADDGTPLIAAILASALEAGDPEAVLGLVVLVLILILNVVAFNLNLVASLQSLGC